MVYESPTATPRLLSSLPETRYRVDVKSIHRNSQPFRRIDAKNTEKYQIIPNNTIYSECPAVNNAEVGIPGISCNAKSRLSVIPSERNPNSMNRPKVFQSFGEAVSVQSTYPRSLDPVSSSVTSS